MLLIRPAGLPAPGSAEQAFITAMADAPGVLISGMTLPGNDPSEARECDGIYIAPHGLFTIEVKGTPARGELTTSPIEAWKVGGDPAAFYGHPGHQANLQCQLLAQLLRKAHLHPGWIAPVVAIAGAVTLPNQARCVVAGRIHVTVINDAMPEAFATEIRSNLHTYYIGVETALAILGTLGAESMCPSPADLVRHGFTSDKNTVLSAIAANDAATAAADDADDDADGQTRAHDEANETAGNRPPLPHAADAVRRHRQSGLAQQHPSLIAGHAVVGGAAFTAHAAERALRLGLSLHDLAALLSTRPQPVLTHPGWLAYRSDAAVALARAVDSLIVDCHTSDIYSLWSEGFTHDDVIVPPHAAQQAVDYGLDREALLALIYSPTDTYLADPDHGPHTSPQVRVLGDYAAVVSPHRTVTRVVAHADLVAERLIDNEPLTLAGRRLGPRLTELIRQGSVSPAAVINTLTRPEDVFEGARTGTEVRLGDELAVIINTHTEDAVAIVSRFKALSYRDGVDHRGWHVAGKAMWAAHQYRLGASGAVRARVEGTPHYSEQRHATFFVLDGHAVRTNEATRTILEVCRASELDRRADLAPLDQDGPTTIEVNRVLRPSRTNAAAAAKIHQAARVEASTPPDPACEPAAGLGDTPPPPPAAPTPPDTTATTPAPPDAPQVVASPIKPTPGPPKRPAELTATPPIYLKEPSPLPRLDPPTPQPNSEERIEIIPGITMSAWQSDNLAERRIAIEDVEDALVDPEDWYRSKQREGTWYQGPKVRVLVHDGRMLSVFVPPED